MRHARVALFVCWSVGSFLFLSFFLKETNQFIYFVISFNSVNGARRQRHPSSGDCIGRLVPAVRGTGFFYRVFFSSSTRKASQFQWFGPCFLGAVPSLTESFIDGTGISGGFYLVLSSFAGLPFALVRLLVI